MLNDGCSLRQSITLQSTDGVLVLRIADKELGKFSSSIITFQRDINMNKGLITNLRSPDSDGDAANKN